MANQVAQLVEHASSVELLQRYGFESHLGFIILVSLLEFN